MPVRHDTSSLKAMVSVSVDILYSEVDSAKVIDLSEQVVEYPLSNSLP